MDRQRYLEPICPRCGYDQRGVIATWTEASPLESICAECGLRYSCAELLMPEKFEPQWCVEFARGDRRRIARSCAGTLARSFAPWRFWSRLKMSHRIRPRRLGVYVCSLLLPFLLLVVLAQAAVAMFVYSQAQQQMRMQGWAVPWQIQNLTQRIVTLDRSDAEAVARLEAALRAQIAALRTAQAPTLDHSRTDAVVEALFMPLGSSSSGTFTYADGTTAPYPGPASLWPLALWGGPLWPAGPWIGGTGGALGLVQMAMWTRFALDLSLLHLFVMLVAYAIFPLTFALLPISRRRAKVRWAHIARVGVYGLFIPFYALLIAMSCATFIVAEVMWFSLMFIGAAVTIALPVGTAMWWAFAIGRYLKMPHAVLVSASLMVLTILAICAATWVATDWAVVPDSWWLLI